MTVGTPPGLYLRARPPQAAPAPRFATGVPVFVGFARPRPEALERRPGRGRYGAVVVERWEPRGFAERVAPAPQSFLAPVVHGFFANGGRRCVVLAVPPPERADGADRLLRTLEPGGPLEERSDVDLLCVPDAVSPLARGEGALQQIHQAALAHCEATGDRFAILDAPDAAGPAPRDPVDAMLSWLLPALRSPHGALYFPWLAVDPAQDRRPPSHPAWRRPDARPRPDAPAVRFIPPSGHVAGLYARLDERIGPQRAPANEVLENAVDTSVAVTRAQHGRLNDGGVNCLRGIRGRGIEVGGARTLGADPHWAHVSTARVVIGFRRWLAVGLADLVFEPHTSLLRDRVRVRLVARCLELLNAGALAGRDAAEAFFVKCDDETAADDGPDHDRVVAHVGLAPTVPAEFIVVRVTHDANGATVSALG